VVDSAQTAKFEGMDASLTRISIGAPVTGWHDVAELYKGSTTYKPDAVTRATDPMLLYFTSGTTAKPKLVLHTHQSYPVGHLTTMFWVGLREGDVHYNISSPGWAKHAWSSFFAPWNAGACIFVYRSARFSAAATLQVIVDKGVTTLCAPPTVWRLFIQEDLAAYKVQLRGLVGAGEPLNPEVISQVEKAWGLTIRDGYGQTETTALVGNAPGQPVKAGSMGRPLPGYEVVLLDADGHEAEEGEIALKLKPRPLGLMVGYKDDPAKMAHAEEEGFYRTGDVASRDADGYLFFVGRADDVFKSSDYRISPFELESFLIEHEAVAEAAVVPSPDPLKLAVPKAYIILRTGFPPDRDTALALFRFIRERLSPYKRIRILEFADLPKTISGKIRRVELRKRAAEQTHSPLEFREEQFPELK
jgi:acetyl-CoA synthetase